MGRISVINTEKQANIFACFSCSVCHKQSPAYTIDMEDEIKNLNISYPICWPCLYHLKNKIDQELYGG